MQKNASLTFLCKKQLHVLKQLMFVLINEFKQKIKWFHSFNSRALVFFYLLYLRIGRMTLFSGTNLYEHLSFSLIIYFIQNFK